MHWKDDVHRYYWCKLAAMNTLCISLVKIPAVSGNFLPEF